MKRFLCFLAILIFIAGCDSQKYEEKKNNKKDDKVEVTKTTIKNLEDNKDILLNYYIENQKYKHFHYGALTYSYSAVGQSDYYITFDEYYVEMDETNSFMYIIPFTPKGVDFDNSTLDDYKEHIDIEKYKYTITEVKKDKNAIVFSLELDGEKKQFLKLTYRDDAEYIRLNNFFSDPNRLSSFQYDLYFDKDVISKKMIAERNEKNEELNKYKMPRIGMTASEVRKTKWGNPDDINKDTYSWGTREQWVYDKYGYVYFENGIVTSVSER